MKIKDITECSGRWSTPLGTMDAHAPVADGVLVGLTLWVTSNHRARGAMPGRKIFQFDQGAAGHIRPRPSVSTAKPRAETPRSPGRRD
jgi:hypothetical protein